MKRTALSLVIFASLVSRGAQADDPEGDSPPTTTDTTETDAHIAESVVHFAFDSDVLTDEGREQLVEAAAWIRQNDTGLILIEGHADKVGTAPYNKDLAQRRARAARDFLLAAGVTADRVKILSYGEGLPLDETEAPSRTNRRIVLMAVQKEPIVETSVSRQVVTVPAPADDTRTVEKPIFVDRVVPVLVTPPPRRLIGLEVLAGGGVTGFIDDHTNDVTDVGGTWSARVVAGTDRYLGFEAAYVGSAQDIDALGVDQNAVVLGNGLEGNLRLNLTRRRLVQPYAFAGVGWTHYQIENSEVETSSIEEDDDVLVVPVGAGVSFHLLRNMTLDLRGTFRGAAGDSMFEGGADEDNGLESLAGTGQLGFAF